MYRSLALALVFLFVATAPAEVPHAITYQGRLTDTNGEPLDGEFSVIFTIYDAPEEGNALWTSGPQPLGVAGGLFTYELAPIPDSVFLQITERWLGITVNESPELLPRIPFNSVAYAYRALFADGAGFTEMAGHADNATEADHAAVAEHCAEADHAIFADTAFYALAAPGGEITLPYYGSLTSANPGFIIDNSGAGSGIRGESSGDDGVVGFSAMAGKSGVYGYSPAGIGVTGRSEGDNHGVFGETITSDTLHAGVFALGVNRGIIARASGNDGIGVYGVGGPEGYAGYFIGGKNGTRTDLTPGEQRYHFGQYTLIDGRGISHDSAYYGGVVSKVYGDGNDVTTGFETTVGGAAANYGVIAFANNSITTTGYSYIGVSSNAAGGDVNYGIMSMANIGSAGDASDSLTCGISSYGLNGKNNYAGLMFAMGPDTNYAVYAEALSGEKNYAIYAKAPPGVNDWAGYFEGDVNITGSLWAGTKYFKIDHPLDPANKYLIHSCVESSEQKNVYDGVALLDRNGRATVQLPEYFEALNRDFRYQLTAIGAPGPNLYIAEEIADNSFTIAGGQPGSKVSWMVTGIRNDAAARSRPIQTVVDKPPDEKGTYLNPAAYGLGDEYSLHYQEHRGRQQEYERVLQEQQNYQSKLTEVQDH